MTCITAYCRITDDTCVLNGDLIQQRDNSSDEHWLKQLYKTQQLAYPKFHKMDLLAQSGFIASEMIRRAVPWLPDKYGDDEIALVFANKSASADTDIRFIDSYKHQGAPSPSLFVYTLPNIALGEIAIFNKWYGENMFAVLPKFVAGFFIDYVRVLLTGSSKAVLCGWLEVVENQTDVMLFFVENDRQGAMPLNSESLSELYNSSSTNSFSST